ncbi:MAG: hypothetical protein A2512_04755 [Deltaproteobacteria bacterium RIFOXYD12_FULL_56_24]|nr:MAG: hypothetical protein A2512_04755 [Deltaproteobacteria bacterium RIFOXYD12_FULL_56_24]
MGEIKMKLGDRIKQIRGVMSQKDFGALFGITANTLRRYELDENPPDADFISALCKHYETDANWLLFGLGHPPFKGLAQRAAEGLYSEPERPKGLAQQAVEESMGLNQPKRPRGLAQRIFEDGPDADGAMACGDFHLSMGDSMELLVNIHKSGNNILIRAINANLMAFNEAIENRARSETTINAIREMREQMNVMQEDLATLRQENQELQRKLLSRGDREQQESAG